MHVSAAQPTCWLKYLAVALATVHFKHLGQDAFTPLTSFQHRSLTHYGKLSKHVRNEAEHQLSITGALVPASFNLIHAMKVWDFTFLERSLSCHNCGLAAQSK
jgi:hypothetical protein